MTPRTCLAVPAALVQWMRLACLGTFLALAAGCASLPEGHQSDPRDPFERYNRAMFDFNTEVDEAILKPVAQGYRNHVPDPIQKGVGNFFGNSQTWSPQSIICCRAREPRRAIRQGSCW